MPNSLLCSNGELNNKDPLASTHTLVYHNLESSPVQSNDVFVTPRSDFSEDPIRKEDDITIPLKDEVKSRLFDDVITKHDITETLTSAGSSLTSTLSVDYSLLNKCPVNRICLINDELTSGPCLAPQAILLINDEGPCISPPSEGTILSPGASESPGVEAGSSPLQPIVPYQSMEDSPIFSDISAKEPDIIVVEDDLCSDNSVTKLMETPDIPSTSLPPANFSSYSKFFFMNCYSLFTQRTKPDTLSIAKEASKDQINSCDGGVLDTYGVDCKGASFASSKSSRDTDRSSMSRQKPLSSDDIQQDETLLQDDCNLDNAAELLKDVKIGECAKQSTSFVKKHRRIISVVSQTSMTKKRDSTLGFKNYLKGLKPFDHDYNSGSMEHTLDMHHFSYNAPSKNFFMKYCQIHCTCSLQPPDQ